MKDPVCGMDVEPEKATISRNFNGKKVWFCSENCANQFTNHPEKYAAETATPAVRVFRKSAKLPEGETVPVEFMPNQPGEYEFACPMGMFRDKLIGE